VAATLATWSSFIPYSSTSLPSAPAAAATGSLASIVIDRYCVSGRSADIDSDNHPMVPAPASGPAFKARIRAPRWQTGPYHGPNYGPNRGLR